LSFLNLVRDCSKDINDLRKLVYYIVAIFILDRLNKVYTISLASPNDKIKIKSLQKSNVKIEEVSLLGSSSKLNWEQTKDALIVDLSGVETDKNGYALEIRLNQND